MYLYICVSVCVCVCTYIYIYIYIYDRQLQRIYFIRLVKACTELKFLLIFFVDIIFEFCGDMIQEDF